MLVVVVVQLLLLLLLLFWSSFGQFCITPGYCTTWVGLDGTASGWVGWHCERYPFDFQA